MIMKKRFNLNDVDCANCAAKMEERISRLPGVNSASISFMAQKLTLDCEDDKLDEILKAAEAIIKDVDKEASIEY